MSDDHLPLSQRHTDALGAARKRKWISTLTFSPQTLRELAAWGYLRLVDPSTHHSKYERYVVAGERKQGKG